MVVSFFSSSGTFILTLHSHCTHSHKHTWNHDLRSIARHSTLAAPPCTNVAGLALDASGNLTMSCAADGSLRQVAAEAVCPSSTVCAPGASEPAICSAGFYCNTTTGLSAVSGACAPGFACAAGSTSATQTSCSAGYYCPGASSSATQACSCILLHI